MKIAYISDYEMNGGFKAIYFSIKKVLPNAQVEFTPATFYRYRPMILSTNKETFFYNNTLFFLDSFIKNKHSLNNLENDLEVMKNYVVFNYDLKLFHRIVRETIQMATKLVQEKYDILMVRHIEDTVFFEYYLSYLCKLNNPSIKIIAGSLFIDKVVYRLQEVVDHIVIGYGERPIEDILTGKTSEKVIMGSTPTKDDLLYMNTNYTEYEKQGNRIILRRTTACPHQCTFCPEHLFNRKIVKVPVEILVESIEKAVKEYNTTKPIIIECSSPIVFFSPKEFEIFYNGISKIKDRIKFRRLYLNVFLDKDPYFLMRLCKLKGSFRFGLDHLSERILSIWKKPITPEKNLELLTKLCLIRNSRSLGETNITALFIYNFPTETKEEFIYLVNNGIKYLDSHFVKFKYTSTIELDPKKFKYEFIYYPHYYEYFNYDEQLPLAYQNLHDRDKLLSDWKDQVLINAYNRGKILSRPNMV